jgi:hypothetical protein
VIKIIEPAHHVFQRPNSQRRIIWFGLSAELNSMHTVEFECARFPKIKLKRCCSRVCVNARGGPKGVFVCLTEGWQTRVLRNVIKLRMDTRKTKQIFH